MTAQTATVHIIEDRRPATLVLSGTVSTWIADELFFAALRISETDDDVVVDCAGVEHLGAAALQILIALRKAVGHRGRTATFVGLPAPVTQLLSELGFAEPLGLSGH